MVIKILCLLSCGLLGAWGGYSWNVARRYGMPALLSLYVGIQLHSLISLWMLLAIPVLCCGYGEDAPLTHVFGGNWGRGVWGCLVALAFSLPLLLTGHILWYWFASYLILGFSLEPLCKKLWQVAGDIIIFSGFGSIVYLIH